MRLSIAVFIALMALSSPSRGQTRDSLTGAAIRFRLTSWREQQSEYGWMEGRLVRASTDTVLIRVCSHCRDSVLALTPLSQFDIARHRGFGGSRHDNAGRGAVIGAAVGLLAAGYEMSSCGPPGDACRTILILAVPINIALGGVGGILVGGAIPPGRWEQWPAR